MCQYRKLEKKDGTTIEKYFFPLGRGVLTRTYTHKPSFRCNIYNSDLCRREKCVYDTAARKTCKNCEYKF